jgi:UDP-N-acetylmuramoylalanine--D-glutamate ligase
VYPNHLDRHGDMETYERIKSRLFDRMNDNDTAVVPANAKDLVMRVLSGQGHAVTFGMSPGADYIYRSGRVHCRQQRAGHSLEDEEEDGGVSVQGTLFDNEILGLTAAAAAAAVEACGYGVGHVGAAAKRFCGLPHRMQKVTELSGVSFVDDSKATNLAALCAAVRISGGPVRLIAGGQLKEKNLDSAKELLANRATCVYLIGEATEAMAASWQDSVVCEKCENLAEAVHRAWQDAKDGETVLLSPGCASFDQFLNFEERGDQFKAIVGSLAGRN